MSPPSSPRSFTLTVRVFPRAQVRVVEHKKSKKLYALKYIDKAKCIKQKAVANIIQERRLLEEVRQAHVHIERRADHSS